MRNLKFSDSGGSMVNLVGHSEPVKVLLVFSDNKNIYIYKKKELLLCQLKGDIIKLRKHPNSP